MISGVVLNMNIIHFMTMILLPEDIVVIDFWQELLTVLRKFNGNASRIAQLEWLPRIFDMRSPVPVREHVCQWTVTAQVITKSIPVFILPTQHPQFLPSDIVEMNRLLFSSCCALAV